jgi:hypothetical protein
MREHLHIDAGRIHGGEPPLPEIEETRDHIKAQELFTVAPPLRARWKVLLFFRKYEMLLQRDDFHLQTRLRDSDPTGTVRAFRSRR